MTWLPTDRFVVGATLLALLDAQREAAEASRERYAERLGAAGYGDITTEIVEKINSGRSSTIKW